MSGRTGIKVFAPASIANFSTGFSIVSAAIDQPGDEIIASIDNDISGVVIDSITGYKKGLSLEVLQNSAALAGQLLLDKLNNTSGIRFKIHKKTPLNSGLSSNASSAVAGVFAVNELLGRPLERYDLLPFAIEAASRFDILSFPAQVSSILFGGIILYRDIRKDSFQKLYTPHGIQLTLIIPEIQYSEAEKLSFLQKEINYLDSRDAISNSASMVSALYTSDFELFADNLRSNPLNDILKKDYQYFEELETIAIEHGAFGCSFAGFGPVVFIASPNSLIAEEISAKIEPVFKKLKIDHQLINTRINLNGVYIY